MSSVTVIPTNGVDLNITFGPLYWGFVISLLLAGINIVQGYFYFLAEDKPKPKTKAIALTMLLLNVASSALVARSLYYYLVPHFGSLLPLNSVTRELSAECFISTIMTFISQMYFPLQIYKVSKHRLGAFAAYSVGVSAILSFAFGTACSTVMIVHPHAVLASRGNLFNVFFGLAKGFGALTDIMATIAICAVLASSRTGFNRTDTLINTLLKYMLQRGVLVTLIQFLLLVVFFAAPSQLFWFSFHVNVTKLYANTFFSMLNGREQLYRDNACHTYIQDVHVDAIASGQSNRGFKSRLQDHATKIIEKVGHKSGVQDEVQLDVIKLNPGRKGYQPPAMPTVTKTVLVGD